MTAPTCPHCFAPVRGDGRPTCLCAAVDADDFDPLRVRPYVSLPGEDDDVGDPARGDARDADDGPDGGFVSRGDPLDDLPGVDAAVHRADDPSPDDRSAAGSPRSADPFLTGPLPAHPFLAGPLPADPPLPGPFLPGRSHAAGPASAPAARGPLFPGARRRPGPTSRTFSASEEEPATGTPVSAPGRRRGLPAVLAAAGAAVAAAAVLITTDALSGDTRDRAAPPDHGAASPSADVPTDDAPAPLRSSAAPSRSATRSPSPAVTGVPGPTTGVRLYRTEEAPAPAPTRASGSVTHSPGSHGPSAPPTGPIVLREGATGPEVAELQGRLRQLALYPDPADGHYGAQVRAAVSRYQHSYGVTGDPDGVYGAPTRASLESRTHEP
ncbi:peptidoglycan-binding protein [Streptomyces caniferus]|uniref:peptidoglycan-binding protein n=1 Tax=Streptomyces caniferus TaxID=285557 RepID=UPI00371A1A34